MYFISRPDQKRMKMHFGSTIERLEAFIRKRIQSRVGFTIDPLTAHSVDNDSWAVSIGGHEGEFIEEPTRDALLHDIVEKLSAIIAFDFPLYLGGWPQDGSYYLDLSRLILSREEAVDFAKANDQKAIFHLRTGKTLHIAQVPHQAQLELLQSR